MSSDNTSNTSYPEAMRTVFEHFIADLNTCLPGTIIKIDDFKKRKISVKPELKKVYLDGETLEPPIIENVPLKFTGSSKAILHFPIEVGDSVILIFSQRSLDNWLSKGELTTPGDNRKFDLSDTFAIPGVISFKTAHSLIKSNQTVTLSTGTKKLTINNQIEDFAKLIFDLMDEIIAIQTVGSPPQHVLSPDSIAAFTAIKVRMGLLLEEG